MSLHKKIAYFLLTSDIQPVAFFLAIHTFLWGFWVALPFDTFGSSPSFRVLSRIGPEWVTGSLLMILAAAFVYMTQRIGFEKGKFIALILATYWAIICASLAVSNPWGTGLPTYSVITIGYLYLYLRIF